MTAEGLIFIVSIAIGIVVAVGTGIELLAIFAKNPKIKYVPVIFTGLLFLATWAICGNIAESAPAFLGILTVGETLTLLCWFFIKKLKK